MEIVNVVVYISVKNTDVKCLNIIIINGDIFINNYNIRTITIKLCKLLLVSYTINRVKIITIKMCVVISIVYY